MQPAQGGSVNADEADFDAFYVSTSGRLVSQLHAMTGDLAEAQDCVQEAYARAWSRWRQVSQHASPEAWVRKVAWRQAVSRFRRVQRGRVLMQRVSTPQASAAVSADRVALVAALRQLPEAQRVAVVLHYLAGQPLEAVAAETGVPVGTVKSRLSRARTALVPLLADTQGESRAR
jgi:RNA polymerase sigma-70 factor (ECF subfamily)